MPLAARAAACALPFAQPGAFAPEAETDVWPRAAQAATPTVTMGCARALTAADEAGSERIPCLGWVDEASLVETAAAAGRAVSLLAGACVTCPSAGAQAVAGTMVQRANALLRALGRRRASPWTSLTPAQATATPGRGEVSRRDLSLCSPARVVVRQGGSFPRPWRCPC